MRINIWINKREAVSGKITKWYTFGPPQSSNWPEYVQVSISQDEFARLEDRDLNNSEKLTWAELDERSMKADSEIFRGEDWLVEQYNRNRDPEDWVETREEIPYIYERSGDDVFRRRTGDHSENRELLTNDEFHSTKKPIKRDLKKLVKELQTIPGAKFDKWWKGLTKEEQIELTKFWE